MVKSQHSGDIITKVMLFYFFSILLLIAIANISVWMYNDESFLTNVLINIISIVLLVVLYRIMINKSDREFLRELDKINLGEQRNFLH
jgi:L-asparagine transporter-like permease